MSASDSRDDPRQTYRRLRAAHLNAVTSALEDHVARLAWSREQIDRYQQQRLRALLGFARERSRFHARRLRGLDTSSAAIEDLQQLPIMTKQDAQRDWDEIVTGVDLDRGGAERVLAEQQWFSYTPSNQQLFSSGGSSGVRGVYVWDWEFAVSVTCLAWRMQAAQERRSAHPSPALLAVLAAGGPPHASTPLFDVPTTPDMTTAVIPAGEPFDDVRAAVAAARPSHLVGYATVIGKLARATLAGDLDIRPVRVSTNSEPLFDEDRRAIGQAWGAPLHNLWGSTEIGVQAVGCGLGDGLHVCEDEVILERVDDNGNAVAADAPAARTLATGLANRTFPFIRYDLGDQVRPLAGDCACGSAFARVADIGGRRDDDFRYPTSTIPASVFRHILGTDPRVSEYQVKQTVGGAEILAVGNPDADQLASSVVEALRDHGLSDPEIQIQVVQRIPRHQTSGKLRRFVPLSAQQ
ncbi:MAG: phenylacetate--CoA ligase family protein [Actinomycetia bacterium]|nr:phenylacetate--CoA ligase family protein [Actinomycetes bacterium]MCH9700442.1 phenylacetate--CoA ligase family protein [Actinomycetes bacterium]MCH9759766.1 phenylacetate--CoA ligase family protein [Actinomycetes bacterium]